MRPSRVLVLLLLLAAPAAAAPFPRPALPATKKAPAKPRAAPGKTVAPTVAESADSEAGPGADTEEFLLWRKRAREGFVRTRRDMAAARDHALTLDRAQQQEEEEARVGSAEDRTAAAGSPRLSIGSLVLLLTGGFLIYLLSRRFFSTPSSARTRRARPSRVARR